MSKSTRAGEGGGEFVELDHILVETGGGTDSGNSHHHGHSQQSSKICNNSRCSKGFGLLNKRAFCAGCGRAFCRSCLFMEELEQPIRSPPQPPHKLSATYTCSTDTLITLQGQGEQSKSVSGTASSLFFQRVGVCGACARPQADGVTNALTDFFCEARKHALSLRHADAYAGYSRLLSSLNTSKTPIKLKRSSWSLGTGPVDCLRTNWMVGGGQIESSFDGEKQCKISSEDKSRMQSLCGSCGEQFRDPGFFEFNANDERKYTGCCCICGLPQCAQCLLPSALEVRRVRSSVEGSAHSTRGSSLEQIDPSWVRSMPKSADPPSTSALTFSLSLKATHSLSVTKTASTTPIAAAHAISLPSSSKSLSPLSAPSHVFVIIASDLSVEDKDETLQFAMSDENRWEEAHISEGMPIARPIKEKAIVEHSMGKDVTKSGEGVVNGGECTAPLPSCARCVRIVKRLQSSQGHSTYGCPSDPSGKIAACSSSPRASTATPSNTAIRFPVTYPLALQHVIRRLYDCHARLSGMRAQITALLPAYEDTTQALDSAETKGERDVVARLARDEANLGDTFTRLAAAMQELKRCRISAAAAKSDHKSSPATVHTNSSSSSLFRGTPPSPMAILADIPPALLAAHHRLLDAIVRASIAFYRDTFWRFRSASRSLSEMLPSHVRTSIVRAVDLRALTGACALVQQLAIESVAFEELNGLVATLGDALDAVETALQAAVAACGEDWHAHRATLKRLVLENGHAMPLITRYATRRGPWHQNVCEKCDYVLCIVLRELTARCSQEKRKSVCSMLQATRAHVYRLGIEKASMTCVENDWELL